MFLKRLITGLILSIATILGIYFLSVPIFISAITMFMLWAALEWTILMNCSKFWIRLVYVGLIAAFICLSTYIPLMMVLWAAFIFWFATIFLIFIYPKGSDLWGKGMVMRGFMGVFALVPTWLSMIHVRLLPHGQTLIIFMLLLIWAVDTGGYLTGKCFGKHPMLPSVSPSKTKEGFWGSLILPLMTAVIGCFILNIPVTRWLLVMSLTLFIALFAVIGDLFESMLKRKVGLKDLAQYLPGHGGLLDRIDSMLAAAPMFLFGLMFLNLMY